MKLKKILIVLGMLALVSPVSAELANRPYLALRAGGEKLAIKGNGAKDDKAVFDWVIGLGTRLNHFRLELEWNSTGKAKYDTAKVNQQRYMLQGYYDLPIRSAIRPYLNLGAGAAYTEVEINREKDDQTKFAWNAGAGIGINVTRFLSFDVGYRYVNGGKPKLLNVGVKTSAHEGYVGARASF